jgi:hypothetical protein
VFKLPEDLQPLMDDSVLSVLTKRFSLASDEGPFEVAMTTGKTILAIYLCIYPALLPPDRFAHQLHSFAC